MEKRNNRPGRPLNERRQFFDSENRPVTPRRPAREGEGREERPERREGGFSRGSDTARSDKPRYPHRPATDRSIDMIFGLRPILEALNAGRTLDKIFLLRGTKNSMTQDIQALAKAANIPMSMQPIEKLDGITKKNH